MNNREHYDEIYNSLVNGQRKQAASQMAELGAGELPELLDYLSDELNQPEMAIDAAKSYFRSIAT